MLANVVDIVLGFGGEMVTYGAKAAAEWFDVFQRSPFEGLYALGILNVVYMLGVLPVFVGMLVVHRHTHPISASFALLLSVLATGIYISSNAGVPMLELAQQHAVATTDAQRWALVGAGEAVLARGEDFTPGTFVGLLLSGLAAIVISIVMLRGGVFADQRVGGDRRLRVPHAVHVRRHICSGVVRGQLVGSAPLQFHPRASRLKKVPRQAAGAYLKGTPFPALIGSVFVDCAHSSVLRRVLHVRASHLSASTSLTLTQWVGSR
jgi:hypothetical protein